MAVFTAESAIFNLLKDNVRVAAKLTEAGETRVFPQFAPQDAKTPYIVYSRVSGSHQNHMLLPSGLAAATVQIDVISGSYAEMREVAELVRLALDGFRGVVTGIAGALEIPRIFLTDERDQLSNPSGGRETGRHWHSMDFEVWHKEEVPTFVKV